MGNNDILRIINEYSIPDRIRLVEAILKMIREEEVLMGAPKEEEFSGEGVLAFAGILDEESAKEMQDAVDDSRKIDTDEW